MTRNSISDETKARIRQLQLQSARDRVIRKLQNNPNNDHRKRKLEDEVRMALRPDVDELLNRPRDDGGYEAPARPRRGVYENLKDIVRVMGILFVGDRATKDEMSDALRQILHRGIGGRGKIAGRSAK